MKIIVITGASDGIGAEIARQLASEHQAGVGLVLAARKLNALQAVAAQECARLVIEGMNRRAREVVMTSKGKLGRWLKLLAPGLVEKMALNAVRTEFQPK